MSSPAHLWIMGTLCLTPTDNRKSLGNLPASFIAGRLVSYRLDIDQIEMMLSFSCKRLLVLLRDIL